MDAAISIGAKTGEYMVEPIGQQVGYLIHLNSSIKNLKDQFQKLVDKRHGVQLLIDAEGMNGQVILPEVNRWVENADEIRQRLQRQGPFMEEIFRERGERERERGKRGSRGKRLRKEITLKSNFRVNLIWVG